MNTPTYFFLPLLFSLLTLFTACQSGAQKTTDNTQKTEKVLSDPNMWLGKTVDQLTAAKGEAELGHSPDQHETLLAHLAYEEAWFGIPGEARYLIDDRNQAVVQLNLLPDAAPADREQVIAAVSEYNGLPVAQGNPQGATPSLYFAYWYRPGYTLLYQEFQDRIELYCLPDKMGSPEISQPPADSSAGQ